MASLKIGRKQAHVVWGRRLTSQLIKLYTSQKVSKNAEKVQVLSLLIITFLYAKNKTYSCGKD